MVVKSLGNVQLPPALLFITAWQPLSCMRPPVSGWKVGDVSSPFCVSQSSRLGGSGSWRNFPDFHHVGREWPDSFCLQNAIRPLPVKPFLSPCEQDTFHEDWIWGEELPSWEGLSDTLLQSLFQANVPETHLAAWESTHKLWEQPGGRAETWTSF